MCAGATHGDRLKLCNESYLGYLYRYLGAMEYFGSQMTKFVTW